MWSVDSFWLFVVRQWPAPSCCLPAACCGGLVPGPFALPGRAHRRRLLELQLLVLRLLELQLLVLRLLVVLLLLFLLLQLLVLLQLVA